MNFYIKMDLADYTSTGRRAGSYNIRREGEYNPRPGLRLQRTWLLWDPHIQGWRKWN
ncbi:MAG: hypothetical protein NT092_07485 [Bacteroidia bacterium]|nr:hypothetical protein [Bacteroidia bacterium]